MVCLNWWKKCYLFHILENIINVNFPSTHLRQKFVIFPQYIQRKSDSVIVARCLVIYIHVPINISVRPWVEEVTLRNNRSVRKAERSRLVQEANMIVKKPSFKSLIIAALWNVTLSLMSTFPWQWCKIMKHSYTFYQLQYQILLQKIAIIKKKKTVWVDLKDTHQFSHRYH